MSRSNKVWCVTVKDCEADLGYMLVRAETRGKAKLRVLQTYLYPGDAEFTELRARHRDWLDWYDGDLDSPSPDALMAMLRHDWPVPNHGFTARPDHDDLGDPIICREHADPEGEAGYQRYAQLIGAAYPDRFKPKEEA